MAVIPTILVGLITGILILFLTTGSDKSSLFAYEKTMRNDFDTTAKWETETVITILETVNKKHLSGKISKDSAMNEAADIIRNLKYGKDGYFWVDQSNGINIVSSVREHEGTNRMDLKDHEGKLIIKDFIQTAKKGGGFCDYHWRKNEGGKPLPKRSYVAYYKPFDWIIGTGNYVDDIDNEVNKMKGNQTAFLKKMTVIIFVVVLVVIIIIYFASKQFATPIKKLTRKSERIASGKLDVTFNIRTKDEIGVLALSMRSMVEKLSEIVNKITDEANLTAKTSYKFRDASENISDSANLLTSTGEQVASSIEEMAAGIQLNADNARESVSIYTEAADKIKYGSENAIETAKALKLITHEIGIIEEIVRQTNLLALNASIQASKAGEEGKGFGVIADEIRNLSESSKAAANKIQKLSRSSIKNADLTVTVFSEVLPELKKTLELVQSISVAGNEQEITVKKISHEISVLNQLSQKNADIANQTSENSYELEKQSKKLLEAIDYFKDK